MKPSRVFGACLLLLAASCGQPSVRGSAGGNGGSGAGGSAGRGGSGTGAGGGFTLPDAGNPGTAGVGGSSQPTETMNCGLDKIQLRSKPGQLLLILDRSGSMAQVVSDAQPVEKWGEVVKALDSVLEKTEANIPWGLKLYPLTSICGVPDGLTVPLAANNRQAIMTAIAGNRPYVDGGATPTKDAVLKAIQNLKDVAADKAPHLLVATDGIPNCTNGDSGAIPDPAGAVAALRTALAAGIPAYVVGIATAGTEADATLNDMAVAGGRPRSGATKYYPVANRDELTAAFTSITGDVASCTFPLARTPPVPTNVAVDVGGQRIPPDQGMTGMGAAGGWYYGAGMMSITLTGAACEAVKRGNTDVRVIFGCPGQVIP